ncbi:MAG: hypothetical protein IT209_07290 [Armatimonadetes bacterium]|nr:hypothetical protein [Armatimonadota bacterium]
MRGAASAAKARAPQAARVAGRPAPGSKDAHRAAWEPDSEAPRVAAAGRRPDAEAAKADSAQQRAAQGATRAGGPHLDAVQQAAAHPQVAAWALAFGERWTAGETARKARDWERVEPLAAAAMAPGCSAHCAACGRAADWLLAKVRAGVAVQPVQVG